MGARKLTIAQILPEMDSGGVEMVTLEFGSFLAEKGHRSIVVSKEGRLVPELVKNGSEHISCPHIGEKSPRCLPYIPWLRKFILEEKVDVLHLRSRLPAWVAYLAWKSLPVKKRPLLMTTFHGFYSVNAYSAVMTKGQKVIAISHAISDHIKREYHTPEDRIQIIYEGIDENQFDSHEIDNKRLDAVKKSWGFAQSVQSDKSNTLVILLPARITRLKGHDIFIESLSLIRSLNWIAVCAGSHDFNSSYLDSLKRMVAEKGLENRILFPGDCEDMPAAIKLSSIVVSSSSEPESFGRAAVEAQSMNTPVVATAHGGAIETIHHNRTGILVKPGSADEMAAALKKIMENKDVYTALSSQGRDRVKQLFTKRVMCEKTLALYLNLSKSTMGNPGAV
jgi:glycosyltransferase involved in cell wall biosynthesis